MLSRGKLFGLIIPAIVFCGQANALEIADTAWTKIYWNGYFDSVNCVQETPDSGFIMVGCTQLEGETQKDINLVKTDRDGNLEWGQLIGGEDDETGFHVLPTFDGGYLISANSNGFGSYASYRIWIVKTDAAGDTVWTLPFTHLDGNGFPLCAVQTPDSGYAITGLINVSYDNHAFILRITKNGVYDGSYLYDSDYGHQAGWFITQMPDSGFIVAGQDANTYTTGYDFWAFRTDQGGTKLWDSTYAITGSTDMLYGACRTDDGIVMVGDALGAGYALKIDFDGHTAWSRSISKWATNERISTVCAAPDGGFLVGGWVGVVGYRRDFNFTRLDAEGDTVWTYTVGGGDDDHGRSIVATSDGRYAMVGSSSSFVNGTSFYLAKIMTFLCGDANGDGGVNVSDAVFLINAVFKGGPLPSPLRAGDANCDGGVNVSDAVYLINHVFKGGPAPCAECE